LRNDDGEIVSNKSVGLCPICNKLVYALDAQRQQFDITTGHWWTYHLNCRLVPNGVTGYVKGGGAADHAGRKA